MPEGGAYAYAVPRCCGIHFAMRVTAAVTLSTLVALSSCAAALRAVPPTRASVSMSSTARPFTPNTPRDGGVISEPAAQWALGTMSCVDVKLDTPELRASVRTTFLRPEPSSASEPERPLVLFLHGADFSCLEWRLVMRPLLEAGIDCVALDWYSGGWTDRLPLNARLRRAADALPEEYQKGGGEVTPWAIVRQHLQAFWAQELEGRQLVVVSSSTSSTTDSPRGTTTRLHAAAGPLCSWARRWAARSRSTLPQPTPRPYPS